jgi:putative ABC transport system substrate-binding protein
MTNSEHGPSLHPALMHSGWVPTFRAAALLIALALGLLAPLAAETQQAGTKRIGLLWPAEAPPSRNRMEAFRRGLQETGYVEGRNLAIDVRYAENAERLLELAREMVRVEVSLIASFGDLGPQMAQRATKTIPIVALTDDFVGAGLVTSLGRPEGNTTGVNILSPELSAKRLSLLKEMLPRLSRVAVL